jgi:hypothetical protein
MTILSGRNIVDGKLTREGATEIADAVDRLVAIGRQLDDLGEQ